MFKTNGKRKKVLIMNNDDKTAYIKLDNWNDIGNATECLNE